MQFSFRDAPSWFNGYIMDEFLDEFHTQAHQRGAIEESIKNPRNNDKLLDFAIEFFSARGLAVCKQDRQVWFDINEHDPKYLWAMLKWSEQ